jgi:hypothetical protein
MSELLRLLHHFMPHHLDRFTAGMRRIGQQDKNLH